MGQKVRGYLVIIGGAEDKSGDCLVLREVVHLAGGRDARITVITAATLSQDEAGDIYTRVFKQLGANQVSVLNIESRSRANDLAAVRIVEDATGLFMTGGDQLRITSILGGTQVYEAIQKRYEEGVVVCGTSAGASAMSGAMIVGGLSDDSPKDRSVRLAPGLGLLEEIVVDQHFAQRGRLGRLLAVVAQNPSVLGLGIDEDTAISVGAEGEFKVVGSNSVTVVDGSGIEHTNVTETDFSSALALSHVLLHVLPAGYGFDLKMRKPLLSPNALDNHRK